MHIWSNLALSFLDYLIICTAGGSTRLHGLGVGFESVSHGSGAVCDSLCDDSNFLSLLAGEAEPVGDLGIQFLFTGKSVRGVKKRAGASNNDSVLAKFLNGSLNQLNCLLEIGLPNI